MCKKLLASLGLEWQGASPDIVANETVLWRTAGLLYVALLVFLSCVFLERSWIRAAARNMHIWLYARPIVYAVVLKGTLAWIGGIMVAMFSFWCLVLADFRGLHRLVDVVSFRASVAFNHRLCEGILAGLEPAERCSLRCFIDRSGRDVIVAALYSFIRLDSREYHRACSLFATYQRFNLMTMLLAIALVRVYVHGILNGMAFTTAAASVAVGVVLVAFRTIRGASLRERLSDLAESQATALLRCAGTEIRRPLAALIEPRTL